MPIHHTSERLRMANGRTIYWRSRSSDGPRSAEMRWRSPLVEEFESMKVANNPHRRGQDLQTLVARLFQAAHFKVVPNSGVARPRQTDLLATPGSDAYLIETKWTKAVVDINAVDSLLSRLKSTPSFVVGLF